MKVPYLAEAEEWILERFEAVPSETKAQMVEVLDKTIIYLSNFLNQKSRLEEQEQAVLAEALQFNMRLEEIHLMSQLSEEQKAYLAHKWIAKYSLYAAGQGVLSGTGQILALIADLPVLLSINMRMIQSIANSYGFSLTSPLEQEIALRILHTASLPDKYRNQAFEMLVNNVQGLSPDDYSLYQGQVIQAEWLGTLTKHMMKACMLFVLKKRSQKKLSVFGILTGANANYQFTKKTGHMAQQFYSLRKK
jgi:uncharacterized protein (DUF697 family)